MALRGQRNLGNGVEDLPAAQRGTVRAQAWSVLRGGTAMATLATLLSLLVP